MDVSDWLAKGESFLASRGVDETAANAEFLMAAVLEAGRGALKTQLSRALTRKQGLHFWDLIKKRGRRFPLAYVLGSQPFMGLEIEVSSEALIPRPETEEVVEEAIGRLISFGKETPQILDIGTGTGCISVALASRFPRALVFATDISAGALKLALRNAEKHRCSGRIRFIQEDLYLSGAERGGWADLVISNPPYVPTGIVPTLAPEVLKEPLLALDGGSDGLEALRCVIAQAPGHLKPGAFLVLEIGSDQGSAAGGLLKERGFKDISVRLDAQGRDRIAAGVWRPA